uniref:(California timema) hypothetical protein n=1 Tax=Timema californicum TaxID=61474 RepID=A0A7R9P5D3_TIMCA|nr:unnamed protein product [Timema californicum]
MPYSRLKGIKKNLKSTFEGLVLKSPFYAVGIIIYYLNANRINGKWKASRKNFVPPDEIPPRGSDPNKLALAHDVSQKSSRRLLVLAQNSRKSRRNLAWNISSPVAGVDEDRHLRLNMWFHDHRNPNNKLVKNKEQMLAT